MLRPLLWKEWHEQRWKLLFGTVILLFFTGTFVAAKMTTSKEVVVVIWIFGGLILSLYSAMGIIAPEKSSHTISFLISKPAKAWEIFACKWFFGWLNFVVPMIICILCLPIMNLLAKTEHIFGIKEIVRGSVMMICMATMFYTMTCCFAPKKSSEAFVGFVGLMIGLAIFIHLMLVDSILKSNFFYQSTKAPFWQQITVFINPLFWAAAEGQSKVPGANLNILFIEQAILFVLVVWVGLRKLRRSA